MKESLQMLNQAQELAETGRHAAVLDLLCERPETELANSPTLALLYGIAKARLGVPADGQQWVRHALDRARDRADAVIEARALNVCGAIALESGDIRRATDYLTLALTEAERDGDHATVGRCSNNLGIIANMRGDYQRAVGSFTMALAAFQQASLRSGIAETLHNMAISYRDQGDLENAMRTADKAVHEANESGDLALAAQARGGRAEIRLLTGDAEAAKRELEHALDRHQEIGNVVGEAEDLRVLAGAMAVTDGAEAESLLQQVILRAEGHRRPLLAAKARRDLAQLLARQDRIPEAREHARTARATFNQLGAEAEARALDPLINGNG